MIRLLAMTLACSSFSSRSAPAPADCPRGELSAAYCDRDGNLVADPPPESDQVDPSTLIFSYTPVEDPAVYAKVWDEFVQHLSKTTGKPVKFFPVQSYAAQYEAMRAGRLHVAGVNTGGTPVAVNCAGFVPFAMMAADDGTFGYEMEIIAHPGSGITTPADLKGKKIAFTSPTSNSGFKAPSAILRTEFDLVDKRDFEATFSGKHDNSILGVANGDYDAAAIANSVLERMVDRDVVDEDKIVRVYRSRSFPTTAYGYAHDLKPALADKIERAFFSFDWEGTALEAEFDKEDKFIPIEYARDWEVIRQIDTANGVTYDCR